MTSTSVTGFTIADRNYFVGLVAMLASLRRQGHEFPVIVLDLGLTAPQRDVLDRDFGSRVVDRDEVAEWHPHLLGPFPYLLEPTGIYVYLDADLIVTRPLDDLLASAVEGKVCAVTDFYADRWFPEWKRALTVSSSLRHEPYVNLGCFVFSTEHFPDLLRRWSEQCADLARTLSLPLPHNEPFALGDQDVLNALLMSEVPADRRVILPASVQPMSTAQLARTRLVDVRTLSCTYEGHPTAFLHASNKPKPWQPQRRQGFYGSGYERCLRETVAASFASIRAAETPVVAWLRPGMWGSLCWRYGVWRTAVRGRLSTIRRAARGGRR